MEDNDDVHKEADTTEYAGKIGDNPWKEKVVTVKESSKDGKQVGEEKDEVQDDGDGQVWRRILKINNFNLFEVLG